MFTLNEFFSFEGRHMLSYIWNLKKSLRLMLNVRQQLSLHVVPSEKTHGKRMEFCAFPPSALPHGITLVKLEHIPSPTWKYPRTWRGMARLGCILHPAIVAEARTARYSPAGENTHSGHQFCTNGNVIMGERVISGGNGCITPTHSLLTNTIQLYTIGYYFYILNICSIKPYLEEHKELRYVPLTRWLRRNYMGVGEAWKRNTG